MEFEGHNILKPSKLMPQKSPLLLGIKQSNSWHYKPFSNTESITQGFYKVSCPRVKLLKLVIKTHYYVENLDFWTSSSKSADKIVNDRALSPIPKLKFMTHGFRVRAARVELF